MTQAQPESGERKPGALVDYLLVGLSLSIGWGIRGNFGHEYGAMIPGVLATLAAVLLSGRADWHRRAPFFAFFGALGWSFGGSMSYMQVIAYTHSGHSGSVLYGFACLCVLGFLWGAVGGAGASLPALLDRDKLTEFFAPVIAVFAAWLLQDLAFARWFPENSDFRHQNPLYWYDTDWLAALLAIIAVLVLAAARRRFDSASSLILHMAIGWWAGFLVLVVALGWRMTPPRGDNWAGMLGLVIGMCVYFQRHSLQRATIAALVTGCIGGMGFATAQALKLLGLSTGWDTNWHSLLEQSYGFINGIGLAVALFWLARTTPVLREDPPVRRWTNGFAAGFVLLGVTYLNLAKNPEEWVGKKAMPQVLSGLSADAWFGLAYLALVIMFVVLLVVHRRRPIPLLSGDWLVCGQLLYLVFLWWIVAGNFERALVSFAPVRLVTEGVIFFNAVLCTMGIVLLAHRRFLEAPNRSEARQAQPALVARVLAVMLITLAATTLVDWAVVRVVYGDRQAPGASKHIRFGPDATATTRKPAPGVPHP